MGNKLYIGNLPYSADENSLSSAFEAYGKVLSCKIITDRDTGRSKGFAFVEMETSEFAQEAIENMDGRDFEGRAIKVNEAKPQEKRNDRRGGGGGGGGRW